MLHRRLMTGMISAAMLLAGCEPVDEAVEREEIETKEAVPSGVTDSEENATVLTEEESGNSVSSEETVDDETDGISNDADVVEETTEEVAIDESEDRVAEEDAVYEVSASQDDVAASEAETAEDEPELGTEEAASDLVYDIEALDLPSPEDLPLDEVYIEVNDNVPLFTNEELEVSEPFHSYEARDELGRVGVADALLDVELMPAEERGSISHVDPTGWNQGNYEVVSGNWLYNRSHLIGHQMTGYDGKNNLMTGTRQFNVEGMLPFENFVASVVEDTEMQVRYRVTPLFEDDNLLAHGIVMEGFSVDDNGETLSFNVFVPNQQDGIELDYETGDHALVE
ncbi:DNA/RNA non-specific endonuclease [Alkalibacterium subtropicum]|uniref:DNA/RNA non-specific endonuclease n=1 Tax=Alkalibacterium subtropicum TaxID=753702 RepID=A0A1I1KXW3_9LACT|nr:DNA/RNA non-specific endonuclease [Alkalibacterium subtropicum]SFC62240.1 DNA/RNA non-specific endonuclease [Alkalibacterium subtropicum]